jgi:hypothetical protein
MSTFWSIITASKQDRGRFSASREPIQGARQIRKLSKRSGDYGKRPQSIT